MSKNEDQPRIPELVRGFLIEALKDNKISYEQLAEHTAPLKANESGHASRQGIASVLHGEKPPTIGNAEKIIEGLNAILSEKGLRQFAYTAEGECLTENHRLQVYDAMTKSLHALIELMSDDARSLKVLENTAWALYRAKFPRGLDFYDFDPPMPDQPNTNNGKTLSFSFNSWNEAMNHAKEEMCKHAEAAELHERAAVIAGDEFFCYSAEFDSEKLGSYSHDWTPWEQLLEDESYRTTYDRLYVWFCSWPDDKKDTEEYHRLESYMAWMENAGLTK